MAEVVVTLEYGGLHTLENFLLISLFCYWWKQLCHFHFLTECQIQMETLEKKPFITGCVLWRPTFNSVLVERGVPIFKECPFCNQHEETLEHLLIDYPISFAIWLESLCGVKRRHPQETFGEWLGGWCKPPHGSHNKDITLFWTAATTTWYI